MNQNELLARLDAAVKAITVGDLAGSLLTEEKASRFIRTVSQSTNILSAARSLTMRSHTRDIDRIAFQSRILKDPAAAEADTDGSKPVNAVNQLLSKEVMGTAGLKDDTLEDNIETENFEDTLLDLIATQVGIDLEELFLNGDVTLAGSDDYLALTDGWLKKAGLSVAGTADFPTSGEFLETDVEGGLQAMLDVVDKKYLRDRGLWRYYVSFEIEDAYRDVIRARESALGDEAQTGDAGIPFKGIPVVYAPGMPTGEALLVMPANLVYGLYRAIRVEPDRIPRQRQTDFIITARVDCHFEDENAAVHATGFNV